MYFIGRNDSTVLKHSKIFCWHLNFKNLSYWPKDLCNDNAKNLLTNKGEAQVTYSTQ